MIEQLPSSDPKVLAFKISGTLQDADYQKFVPLIDAEIAKTGTARLLAQFHDFSGWDLAALWDDIKFSTTHCAKIEKIALVGDSAWESWMAMVCKPFTMASIQYFDTKDLAAAWNWVKD